MFGAVTIVVVAATVILTAGHYVLTGRGASTGAPVAAGRWPKLERLAGAILAASVALAAGSGLSGAIAGELEEWLLWVHMLAAPWFAISAAVVAVLLAERCRFGATPAGVSAQRKVYFWLQTALSFVVLSTVMVTMLPLLGQEALEQLLELHGWAGLTLAVVMWLRGYAWLRGRRRVEPN